MMVLTLIGVSFLPYALLRNFIDMFALDGKAEFFTFDKFTEIITRLRFYGCAFLFVDTVLYLKRRWIQQQVSSLLFTLTSLKNMKKEFVKVLKNEEKIHLCAFIVILGIAVAVRLAFLYQPMRYDEALTFMTYASKPIWHGLSLYSSPNNHLFHTLLVHITCLLLGNQP